MGLLRCDPIYETDNINQWLHIHIISKSLFKLSPVQEVGHSDLDNPSSVDTLQEEPLKWRSRYFYEDITCKKYVLTTVMIYY